MKTYHILAALHGEQETSAALVEVNAPSASSVLGLAHSLRHITRNVGGELAVTHCGTYTIHFFAAIPTGFVEGLDPENMGLLAEKPMLLADFDLEALLQTAKAAGLYHDLDSRGLVIEEHDVRVVGFTKNDGRLLSHGIADALDDLLELESPAVHPANVLLRRCLNALEYVADRDVSDEDCRPDQDLFDEVLEHLKTVFDREDLKDYEKYHA